MALQGTSARYVLGMAVSALALVALSTFLMGKGSGRAALLQMRWGLPQRSLGQSLSRSYRELQASKTPVSGRCRCVGVQGRDPEQRVVCACSGKDDLWNKGPWKIVTDRDGSTPPWIPEPSPHSILSDTSPTPGYPVVYDKNDDDPHEFGKYMTIQAIGYPDGPKAPAHYYTLIQPYDNFGAATMPEVYPDASLGMPKDGFFEFETPAPKGYTFSQRGVPQLAGMHDQDSAIDYEPALARLFKQ